ncbi:MAG: hypothetical protein V4663_04875 [Bacteroidota bacterium]
MKKKITLLIIQVALLPLALMAQKTQKLNNSVKITLKETVQPMEERAVEEFAQKNKIEYLSSYEGVKDRAVNIVDGIILTSIKMNTTKKKDLELLKKSIDAIAKSVNVTTHSSRIISDHGYKILIVENSTENRIKFDAVDSTGKSSVSGILEFNSSKRDDAKALLNNIISTIKFD